MDPIQFEFLRRDSSEISFWDLFWFQESQSFSLYHASWLTDCLSLHWACPLPTCRWPLLSPLLKVPFGWMEFMVEMRVRALGLAASPGLRLHFWSTLLVEELSRLGIRYGGQSSNLSQGRVRSWGRRSFQGCVPSGSAQGVNHCLGGRRELA